MKNYALNRLKPFHAFLILLELTRFQGRGLLWNKAIKQKDSPRQKTDIVLDREKKTGDQRRVCHILMTLIFGVSLISTHSPPPSCYKLTGMESYKWKGKSHCWLETKKKSIRALISPLETTCTRSRFHMQHLTSQTHNSRPDMELTPLSHPTSYP